PVRNRVVLALILVLSRNSGGRIAVKSGKGQTLGIRGKAIACVTERSAEIWCIEGRDDGERFATGTRSAILNGTLAVAGIELHIVWLARMSQRMRSGDRAGWIQGGGHEVGSSSGECREGWGGRVPDNVRIRMILENNDHDMIRYPSIIGTNGGCRLDHGAENGGQEHNCSGKTVDGFHNQKP